MWATVVPQIHQTGKKKRLPLTVLANPILPYKNHLEFQRKNKEPNKIVNYGGTAGKAKKKKSNDSLD